MSTTIHYANANEATYRAFVDATLAAFAKAGYKTTTAVSKDAGYYGHRETTKISVVFSESHNATIVAYRNDITAAKAHIAKLASECNIEGREFNFMDVLNWAPMPFEAFDKTGNVVMEISAYTTTASGPVDTIKYEIFELRCKSDADGQKRQVASNGKIGRSGGREINYDATAKRAVKSIGQSLVMHLESESRWALRYNAARIAEERAARAETAAKFAANETNLKYLVSLVPGAIQAKVDQRYGHDAVEVKLTLKLSEVREHLVDKNDWYPVSDQLIAAVAAYIKSKSAK